MKIAIIGSGPAGLYCYLPKRAPPEADIPHGPADLPEAALLAALLGQGDIDRFLVHILSDENLARLFRGPHSNKSRSVQAPQTEDNMQTNGDAVSHRQRFVVMPQEGLAAYTGCLEYWL